ncbi:MAG: phosphodiester glycosidase family protein [Oscillospiraceae bacterium]|nr:phosphodiester glycosidase family protein [Oscillospiraceae bacterium]
MVFPQPGRAREVWRRRVGGLLLALLLVLGLCPSLAAGVGLAPVYEGLHYGAETILNGEAQNVNAFVIRVEADDDSLKVVAGTPNDAPLVPGLCQTTSGHAMAAALNGKNVLAAVNADFFNIGDATKIQPTGLTVKDGALLVPYNTGSGRSFFGVLKDGAPVIGDEAFYNTVRDDLAQAVGGSDCLVRDGVVQIFSNETVRHPRTAVGITADGDILLVVADGRTAISAGLYLGELAVYMHSLGAVEALNLDGGGSSACVVKDPATAQYLVKNNPSDGTERPVGDTLLVVDTDSDSFGVTLDLDADGYYLVRTPADFAQIARAPGANFRLAHDLDLQGGAIAPVPLFGGDFDGGGHTISHLKVNAGAGAYALFTQLGARGVIHDLSLIDVDITAAASRTAALVGSCAGTVRDVTIQGSIAGDRQVGGLIGYLENGGRLLHSAAGVSVTGTYSLGGLVGEMTDDTLVDGCYVHARVLGGDRVAGVAGTALSDQTHNSDIRNCIVTGEIRGAIEPGGVGGLLKIGVEHCLVRDVHITATSTAAVGSGNVAGLLGAWVNGAQPYRYNVVQSGSITKTAACEAHRIGYQTTNKSQNYVSVAVTIDGQPETGGAHNNNIGADVDEAQLTSRAFYENLGFDFETVFAWDETARTPVLRGVAQDVTPDAAGGIGLTQDSDGYYLIRTAADFGGIAKAPLENFRLAGDIDLTGAVLTPVALFGGRFDGAGHTLSHLTADGGGEPWALFSNLQAGGVISDVRFSDAHVRSTSSSYTAVLVGNCYGTVEDVTVTGEIRGRDRVGAIAGNLQNGGYIRRCAVGADVIATGSRAGGVAGFSDGGIARCYAHVKVQSDVYAGGIAGYTDGDSADRYVQDCIVSGAVTARVEAGGVAGLLKMYTHHNIVRTLDATATGTGAVTGGNVAGLLGAWKDNPTAVTRNVVLSGSVTSVPPDSGSRVCYDGGNCNFSENYVNPAVTVNGQPVSGGTDTNRHGADADAAQLTSRAFYEGLGFDFENAFAWDAIARTPVLRGVDQTVRAPGIAPPPPPALTLIPDRDSVRRGERFSVAAGFDVTAVSNAAALTFTFDSEKLAYEGFDPAPGVTVLREDAAEAGGAVTLTLGLFDGYAARDYGRARFTARQDLAAGAEIALHADYVVWTEAGKVVLSADAGAVVRGGVPGDVNGDGGVSLLDLSDLIDAFGHTSDDADWLLYAAYDENRSGDIDIYDIACIARRIVSEQ